jgi:hypothetical protein
MHVHRRASSALERLKERYLSRMKRMNVPPSSLETISTASGPRKSALIRSSMLTRPRLHSGVGESMLIAPVSIVPANKIISFSNCATRRQMKWNVVGKTKPLDSQRKQSPRKYKLPRGVAKTMQAVVAFDGADVFRGIQALLNAGILEKVPDVRDSPQAREPQSAL